jgi:site-specific recombinase XerD
MFSRRQSVGRAMRDIDPTVIALADVHADFMTQGSYAKSTQRAYRDALRSFCRYLAGNGRAPTLETLTLEVIVGWREDLRASPRMDNRHKTIERRSKRSDYTISCLLRPMATFCRYLVHEGWLEISPYDRSFRSLLPTLRDDDRTPKLARPEDVVLLLDVTAGDDWASLRDRAILLVGWSTGMRTDEICRLRVADIDFGRETAAIYDAKGGKDRVVPLGPSADAVRRWLAEGRPHTVRSRGPRATDRLFVSARNGSSRATKHGGLSPSGVLQLLTRRWHQGGNSGTFGAHRLRHGLATILAEANVNLDQIRVLLGHASTRTTSMYVHLSPASIQRSTESVIAASLRGMEQPSWSCAHAAARGDESGNLKSGG